MSNSPSPQTSRTTRALPEVGAAMHRLFEEFPELRRTLKDPYRARVFHDILTEMMGKAVMRSAPSLEQQVANLMENGYHVTTQPRTVIPMRKPGTDYTPPPDDALMAVTSDSQRGRLLLAYYGAGEVGMTDDEAARHARIPDSSCWWKRCGELRRAGLIEPMIAGEDDIPVQREGASGMLRVVCTITPEGQAAVSRFE